MKITYSQPAKGEVPARNYQVDVIFTSHCFTRGYKPGEDPPVDLLFAHDGEVRIFDLDRFVLSAHLPSIVRDLPSKKCLHTGVGNFFVVEIVNGPTTVEYEIFFKTYKANKRGRVTIVVQSAYVRDEEHRKDRPHGKPIGFHIILFNTLNNKPIKPPN